ncbi:hypothetical protein VMCG_10490 [Cytospora schulzeri]|uniref:SUEL-type lectin domain-containing protein n=1 Tax=Cytospora schulzeri TaxID=448051 RepID=A0A423VBI8_9PEZI|nr:hypothetical protein VMCG_10490 [Valsa malicola]
MLSPKFDNILLLLFAACIYNVAGVAASYVAFYSDANCTTLVANTTAQDGYPDGQCTNLTASVNQTFTSFMVSSLDGGCSATMYGPLTTEDSCSGTPVAAGIGICYNTTWVEYSVDECDAASASGGATGSASNTAAAPSSTGNTNSSASLNVQFGVVNAGIALSIGLFLSLL